MIDALFAARRQLEELAARIIAFELKIGMPPEAIAETRWRMGQETAKSLSLMSGKVTDTLRLTARLTALRARRKRAEDFNNTRPKPSR
jgi:hypothetical protein